jgi:hypothetical protein
MSRRYISDRGGALALIEVGDDGDSDIVGPVATHTELDQLARRLLANVSNRDRLPDPVHKLALGYLALLGIDDVVPPPADTDVSTRRLPCGQAEGATKEVPA